MQDSDEPLALKPLVKWVGFKGEPQDQRSGFKPKFSENKVLPQPRTQTNQLTASAAAPRSTYFSSSRDSQRDTGVSIPWKQPSSSSSSFAARQTSPRSNPPVSGRDTRRDDDDPFGRVKPVISSENSSRLVQQQSEPIGGLNLQSSSPPPLITDSKPQAGTWHQSKPEARASRPLTSALVDGDLKPFSTPSPLTSSSAVHTAQSPSAGQAVYKKVAFEKEFPSLKDSQLPLGYAPKEAPYRQTFLSSRVTGNWTSKLADVPAAQPLTEHAAVEPAASPRASTVALHHPQASSSISQPATAAAASAPSADPSPGAAASAAPSGWGSFAHAAGTAATSSAGRGLQGSSSSNGVNALSTDALREQLAVKQSKQLIPVLARKDDSSGVGASSRAARPGSNVKSTLATSKSVGNVLLPNGKLLLSGNAAVSNGTMTFMNKKTSAPLDKPLTSAAPQQQQQLAASSSSSSMLLLLKPQSSASTQQHAAGSSAVQKKQQSKVQQPAVEKQEVPMLGSEPQKSDNQQTAGVAVTTAELKQGEAVTGEVAAGAVKDEQTSSIATTVVPSAAAAVDDVMPPNANGGMAYEAASLQWGISSQAHDPSLSAPCVMQHDPELELAELASYLPGDLLGPAADQQQRQQQAQGCAPHSCQCSSRCEQQAAPEQAAPKFLVSSEEEAFLRSLGWTDADDGTDDVLTEEEIAAFKAAEQVRGNGMAQTRGPTPHGFGPAAGVAPWVQHPGSYGRGGLPVHVPRAAMPPGFGGAKGSARAVPIRQVSVAARAFGAAAFSFGSEMSTTDSEDL